MPAARARTGLVALGPSGTLPGAGVTIINRATQAAPIIYATETGPGTLAQPLTADGAGRVPGWLERGPYAATFTYPGMAPWTEEFDVAPATDYAITNDNWIANQAVINRMLADGAVDLAKLANGAVGADKIAGGAVKNSHLAGGADAITADKLSQVAGSEAVATVTMRNGAVTDAKLAANAVKRTHLGELIDNTWLATGAVTRGKIAGAEVIAFPYTRSYGIAWDNYPGWPQRMIRYPDGWVHCEGLIRHGTSPGYSYNQNSAIFGFAPAGWRPIDSTVMCMAHHTDGAGNKALVRVDIQNSDGQMRIVEPIWQAGNNGITNWMSLQDLHWYCGVA